MVKLVDTLVSGTSGFAAVQVRVLFWAQEQEKASSYNEGAFLFFQNRHAGFRDIWLFVRQLEWVLSRGLINYLKCFMFDMYSVFLNCFIHAHIYVICN
jgi:hypothetical protein